MKKYSAIGVIGVGNMGGAVLEALMAKGCADPSNIWIYDKIAEKAARFQKDWKVVLAGSVREVIEKAEVILFAFKPQDFSEVARECSGLGKGKIVLSILAGMTIERLKQGIGNQAAIVRIMPNLGAKAGESMTAVAGDQPEAVRTAQDIFSACGQTIRLKEEQFDWFTALAGSGPAYFFYLMEALEKEALQAGIGGKEARMMAVQTAIGAAALARKDADGPAELRKRVTSKGGTTEAAFNVFREKNLEAIFRQAFEAACRRGRELSQS